VIFDIAFLYCALLGREEMGRERAQGRTESVELRTRVREVKSAKGAFSE
jgi:hypothetical protein